MPLIDKKSVPGTVPSRESIVETRVLTVVPTLAAIAAAAALVTAVAVAPTELTTPDAVLPAPERTEDTAAATDGSAPLAALSTELTVGIAPDPTDEVALWRKVCQRDRRLYRMISITESALSRGWRTGVCALGTPSLAFRALICSIV
jgi:hypothetical protein